MLQSGRVLDDEMPVRDRETIGGLGAGGGGGGSRSPKKSAVGAATRVKSGRGDPFGAVGGSGSGMGPMHSTNPVS